MVFKGLWHTVCIIPCNESACPTKNTSLKSGQCQTEKVTQGSQSLEDEISILYNLKYCKNTGKSILQLYLIK